MQALHSNSSQVEKLYREHGAALVLFASAIAGERSRAQDAVHQVFLKLIENGDLRQIMDKKAYLFACVRNAVLNDAKVRQRNVALDSEAPWFIRANRDSDAELDLQRALCSLPDDQRQAIILHIWGELTFSQIAEVLGTNSNTAASRYRYALVKMRDAMCAKEDFRANS